MSQQNADAVQDRGDARAFMPDDLRTDVRTLTSLLGRVLTEDAGPELFADVEQLRELAIAALTDDDGDARLAQAEALVDSFTPERADQVARAFTCYFHLVNLAEEYHRVRSLRARDTLDGPSRRDDTLAGAYEQLATEVGEDRAAGLLGGLEFHPVLTAHPTEARRRAISSATRRVSELLTLGDDPRLGAHGYLELERRLLAEVDTLWRTAHLRKDKPSPLDEVDIAMSVFEHTLFPVLPQVYRQTDDWLLGDERGLAEPRARAFIRLGSWIGADRDGNPNVTASTTRQAAAIAADHIQVGS